MNQIRCECAQQLRPVETVGNPCGQPLTSPDGSPPHAPPFQKAISFSDDAALWPAVLDALELLNARIDGLEARLGSLIAIRTINDSLKGDADASEALEES